MNGVNECIIFRGCECTLSASISSLRIDSRFDETTKKRKRQKQNWTNGQKSRSTIYRRQHADKIEAQRLNQIAAAYQPTLDALQLVRTPFLRELEIGKNKEGYWNTASQGECSEETAIIRSIKFPW